MDNPGASATNVGSGNACTLDYIIIPEGFGDTSNFLTPNNYNRFCGVVFGFDPATATAATVLSRMIPFQLGVHTDGGELDTATAPASYDLESKGFAITYTQVTC